MKRPECCHVQNVRLEIIQLSCAVCKTPFSVRDLSDSGFFIACRKNPGLSGRKSIFSGTEICGKGGLYYMKRELQKYLSEGRFGLEKESLRLNKYSLLPSVSDHPFGSDPNISRDFCEAQTEIITPVCQNTSELFDVLHELNERVKNVLAQQDEILWNHSNPPAGYNVRKIRVAQFEGLEKEKKEYRKYLREKYGISKMLLCGIHFNFSFTQRALDAISGILDAGTGSFKRLNGNSSGNFSDSIYLKLAANTMKYAWLITYLTAASPIPAFKSSRGKKEKGCASLRCSRHGYWNNFIPTLDYTTLDAYIDSIQSLVEVLKR